MSFKGAVPGNLADNTKPSTPQSQKQAVNLLKQGGILPPTEKPEDYPVLTAELKRDIIKMLLQQKQPTLANWAAALPVRVGGAREKAMKNVKAYTEEAKEADVLMREIENGLGDAELALKKLKDVMARGIGSSPGAKKLEAARAKAAKHVDQAQNASFVLENLAAFIQKFVDKKRARSSFKGAVPGNLGDNTKPSTPQTQKQAVNLLKEGGILPETENAKDYPVLTASLKRDIIKTLLRRKQPKLATWASRNLQVQAAAVNLTEDLAMTSHDQDQGNHIFKFAGKTKRGSIALFKVIISPSGLLSTKNIKGTPTSQDVDRATNFARKEARGG